MIAYIKSRTVTVTVFLIDQPAHFVISWIVITGDIFFIDRQDLFRFPNLFLHGTFPVILKRGFSEIFITHSSMSFDRLLEWIKQLFESACILCYFFPEI